MPLIEDEDLRRRLMVRVGQPLVAAGSETFVPPRGVQKAAQRALELIKDGKAGSGFTDVGRARAKQLASGAGVSRDVIRRMHSFFARHKNDRKPDWAQKGKETPGYVAHLAWGGDPGEAWARSMCRRFDAEQSVTDSAAGDQVAGVISEVYAVALSDRGADLPGATGDRIGVRL